MAHIVYEGEPPYELISELTALLRELDFEYKGVGTYGSVYSNGGPRTVNIIPFSMSQFDTEKRYLIRILPRKGNSGNTHFLMADPFEADSFINFLDRDLFDARAHLRSKRLSALLDGDTC